MAPPKTTLTIRSGATYYLCPPAKKGEEHYNYPSPIDAVTNNTGDFEFWGVPRYSIRGGNAIFYKLEEFYQTPVHCEPVANDTPAVTAFKRKEAEAEVIWNRLVAGQGLKVVGIKCGPDPDPDFALYELNAGGKRWETTPWIYGFRSGSYRFFTRTDDELTIQLYSWDSDRMLVFGDPKRVTPDQKAKLGALSQKLQDAEKAMLEKQKKK